MRHITPQQNAAMRLRTRLLAAVLAAGCLGGLAVRLAVLMLCDPGGYAACRRPAAARGHAACRPRRNLFRRWHTAGGQRDLLDHPRRPAGDGGRSRGACRKGAERDSGAGLRRDTGKISQRTSNDCLLRRRVGREMADAVRDWCRENGVSGVQIRQDTKRVYPQGDFMGGILGFTDVDNAGLWGLELRYNDELTGENGRILTAKNRGAMTCPPTTRPLWMRCPATR